MDIPPQQAAACFFYTTHTQIFDSPFIAAMALPKPESQAPLGSGTLSSATLSLPLHLRVLP